MQSVGGMDEDKRRSLPMGVVGVCRGGEEEQGDCCTVKSHTPRCCSASPHPSSHDRMSTCMQRGCARGADSARQKPCTQPWSTRASSRRSRAGRPPLWLAHSTATPQPSHQRQRHAEGSSSPPHRPIDRGGDACMGHRNANRVLGSTNQHPVFAPALQVSQEGTWRCRKRAKSRIGGNAGEDSLRESCGAGREGSSAVGKVRDQRVACREPGIGHRGALYPALSQPPVGETPCSREGVAPRRLVSLGERWQCQLLLLKQRN